MAPRNQRVSCLRLELVITNIEGLGTERELQELGSTGVVVGRDGGFGVNEGQLHPPQLVVVIVRILLCSATNPKQLRCIVFSPWLPKDG